MSAEIVEHWLASGRNALIARISLKPIENKRMKGKPLSSQKGQAEAFFLIDDKGNWWVLKKFRSNASLDHRYLSKIGDLLPQHDGFVCGTKRHVLSRGALWRTRGFHYTRDLDRWLDGTVLMPRVTGLDWAALADDIRDGSVNLDEVQRLAICRNLTGLIELLESVHCCHRDLSCGNVFVDINTWQAYLIDFDSFYHPSLRMPPATTCGTPGYTSHHAWRNGALDPHGTWCEHVDRYALALLNSEFLLVRPGARATGEGGMFDPDELRAASGIGIDSVVSQLRAKYPQAAALLETAIQSPSFSDCPSPKQWNTFFSAVPGLTVNPPRLVEIKGTQAGYLARILKRCRPAAPLWPAPSLEQMPQQILQTIRPKTNLPRVELPPDPWAESN